MEDPYTMFATTLGALCKLVVAVTIVERVLAFIFEREWFVRLLLTKDGVSRIPGLKGLIALTVSIWISLSYRFCGHCQRKVARTEFSTDDRELGRPELTPLGECGGAVELEIVS